MPRKNILTRYQLITNGDMSQASITSPVVAIQYMDNIGIQLDFTGTPTGAFEIQGSADYQQDAEGNVQNPGFWIPIGPLSSPATVTGVDGQIFIDINQISAPWIRVVYNKTSGSGTLNAYITGKEI